MVWTAVRFERGIKNGPTVTIGYQAWNRKDAKKKAKPFLSIGLNMQACQEFKIDKARHYALLIGERDHIGWLALVPVDKKDPTGTPVCRLKGNTAVLRFGYAPMLGDDKAAREDLTPQALPDKKDGLMFPAPAWFKSDAKPVRAVA